MINKNIILTVAILILIPSIKASELIYKDKRNILQVGKSHYNFFDGYGLMNQNIESENFLFFIFSFNYQYSKKITKKMPIWLNFSFDFNSYTMGWAIDEDENIFYNLNNLNYGDPLRREFLNFKISMGYNYIFLTKKDNISFSVQPELGVKYIYGDDWIFFGNYPGGFDFASAHALNKGLGVFTSLEPKIAIGNKFLLSLAFQFSYINQKDGLNSPPPLGHENVYPPNKYFNVIPRFGILF